MNPDLQQRFLTDLNPNLGIVHQICGAYSSGDDADREDLYQEILYQLWKSYPLFNGASKFSTWMYRVALNVSITRLRKTTHSPDKVRLNEAHTQIADGNEQKKREEDEGLLHAAIRTLGEVDRAIILLFLEEKSYEEISEITGLTKTNVSVRLVRIKRALKSKMTHER